MVPTKMWKNHSFTTNKLENYGSIYSEKIENFGFYEEQWRWAMKCDGFAMKHR
jgi:hypothetical protein